MERLKGAFYAGVFAQDDLVLQAWQEVFFHGYRIPVEKLTEPVAADCNCVLLVSMNLATPNLDIDRWMDLPVPKVLSIPQGRNYRCAMVIDECRNRRVLDAISGDPSRPKVFAARLHEFKSRLDRLCQGERSLYNTIGLGHRLQTSDAGFIATPFDHECGFEEGAEAALKGLFLKIRNPRNEYQIHQRITEKIATMIDQSRLLVANMAHAPGVGFNPNVFYEMGYGHAKEKTILAFRPRKDEPQAPIDIRDKDYIDYEDGIEVAMTLYWGLKDLVDGNS